MPKPSKFVIPPEAGFPGLPIDDSKPVYEVATTFFNEVIRPRREFQSDVGDAGEWKKMEFGTLGGQTYDLWSTTPWDLKEFGLGVAMYVSTLPTRGIECVLAFPLSLVLEFALVYVVPHQCAVLVFRYFATLQLLCVTFFCCGLMQAQAMSYYKSEMYSDRQVSDG